MEDKYQTPTVGFAIKTVVSEDNCNYEGKIKLADLNKCQITKDYYNLTIKSIKSPKDEFTHEITDNLYYKKWIKDLFAEVNINMHKDKLRNASIDNNGDISFKFEPIGKAKVQEFNIADFNVYLSKPAGIKPEKADYLGTAILLQKQKDKQNHQKIERDFCGYGYIDHNDKLPNEPDFILSIRPEQIAKAAKDRKFVYVNLIGYKNEPNKFAAYISKTKDDKSALYTFKIDDKEFSKQPVNEKGFTKIPGYYDDTLENKNYNIRLTQDVGMGADRPHMKWQDDKKDVTRSEKTSKIPSAKDIKNTETPGKPKTRGME